jgi:signal transduction histidine kinase
VRHYSFDIYKVTLDIEKIKIALLNIIMNAIEAMDKKESILTISTTAKGKKCVITIQDNGKGMTQEDLNSIFEPYYSKKEGGIGLGLTTAQTIIYNHEGTIGVESKEDVGTIFTITFNLNMA